MSPRHAKHEASRQKLKPDLADRLNLSPSGDDSLPPLFSPDEPSVVPLPRNEKNIAIEIEQGEEKNFFTGTINLASAAQSLFGTEEQIRRLKDVSTLSKSETSRAPLPHQVKLGDDYEVLALLGQGGMGFVYKVKDKRKNQLVAVKVVRPELATDPRALKRFEQEAEAAMGLLHPNLVPVYAQGVTADGAPYLVMEYQEGTPLDVVLKEEGTIKSERAVDIFMQICDALQHAHAKGLVHRDLKPSNIILTKTKNAKDIVRIVDFGIAKVLASPESRETLALTHTGDLFGSPSYMSPEQCMGYRLDARSDIYSLGCVMYQVLSGQPPFISDNPVQTIVKHLSETPERLNRPQFGLIDIEGSLEQLVLRCLEKDPRNRYQSMELLHNDLAHVQTGERLVHYVRKRPRVSKEWPLAAKIATLVVIDFFCIAGAFQQHEQAMQITNDANSAITQTTTIKKLFHDAVDDLKYYNLSKSGYFLDRYSSSVTQIPVEFWRLYSYSEPTNYTYRQAVRALDKQLQEGLANLRVARDLSENGLAKSENGDENKDADKKPIDAKTAMNEIARLQGLDQNLMTTKLRVDDALRTVTAEAYRTLFSDPVTNTRNWQIFELLVLILINIFFVLKPGKNAATEGKNHLWHESNTNDSDA